MGEEHSEPKIFSLTEAERTRREVEPWLLEAIDCRRRIAELDEKLGEIAQRIQMAGGSVVPYDKTARLRLERNHLAETVRGALDRIHATGCLVKDLDVGLLDFPALVDDEHVYLCWRVGEDRIRFWHGIDEGFAGRKPIVPGDTGPANPIQ